MKKPINEFTIEKDSGVSYFSVFPTVTISDSGVITSGVTTDRKQLCSTLQSLSSSYDKITISKEIATYGNSLTVYLYKNKNEFIAKYSYSNLTDEQTVSSSVRFSYIAIKIGLASAFDADLNYMSFSNDEGIFIVGVLVTPHYKNLKKQYKKESSQVFFRETLDGKITLWGTDYELVKNAGLEDTLYFKIYQNGKLYLTNSFNKTDCKFNYFEKSVELKLTSYDKYTNILDKYENTYDLLKIAPNISQLNLTKRCVYQIYLAGSDVITNIFGGTYWESDVDEAIDDDDTLVKKYHFSAGQQFKEIDLEGFNYNINAIYKLGTSGSYVDGDCEVEIDDVIYKMPCCIYMKKANTSDNIRRRLSDDKITESAVDGYYVYIKTSHYADSGTDIYVSKYIYDSDNLAAINPKTEGCPMIAISQESPNKTPTPSSFYLGENVVGYNVYGRLLCDVDTASDGTELYDLGNDDFATTRVNLKKCIGLKFTDDSSDNSIKLINVAQYDEKVEDATSYGMDDNKKYFVGPYYGNSSAKMYSYPCIPVNRSQWANTSIWVTLVMDYYDLPSLGIGLEAWSEQFYKSYKLRNAYHIADVIKKLLAQIDTSLTHEATSEYSQYLYSDEGENELNGMQIYITPKSNVLKSEYDQPAQKAEITFKQVMEMLRDVYRCYWFIDEQKRFRIEHIRYFMQGMSYSSSNVQLNLTQKYDGFNKKIVLYDQQEVEFEKSELKSRYEFGWMDDVTDYFGNLNIDIKSKYVEQNETEDITIDNFTSDLDFMVINPDEFSSDGFALLMADSSMTVPIERHYIRNEKQYDRNCIAYINNWYASILNTAKCYMYDMPASSISYNLIDITTGTDRLAVQGIKKCMEHDIEYQYEEDPSTYQNIVTELGSGYVEEVSVDIDTRLITVTLTYTPK